MKSLDELSDLEIAAKQMEDCKLAIEEATTYGCAQQAKRHSTWSIPLVGTVAAFALGSVKEFFNSENYARSCLSQRESLFAECRSFFDYDYSYQCNAIGYAWRNCEAYVTAACKACMSKCNELRATSSAEFTAFGGSIGCAMAGFFVIIAGTLVVCAYWDKVKQCYDLKNYRLDKLPIALQQKIADSPETKIHLPISNTAAESIKKITERDTSISNEAKTILSRNVFTLFDEFKQSKKPKPVEVKPAQPKKTKRQ